MMLTQKLRLQSGWSQEQLSELSGVSTRTIQRIENGQSASVDSLKAIAAVFDIHFNELRSTPMIESINSTDTSFGIDHEEALAFAKVSKIKGFYLHVIQFGVLIAIMCIVNFVFIPEYPWVLWVILGWGSGLAIHGIQVYNKVPFLNADWEKRKVEGLLKRKL